MTVKHVNFRPDEPLTGEEVLNYLRIQLEEMNQLNNPIPNWSFTCEAKEKERSIVFHMQDCISFPALIGIIERSKDAVLRDWNDCTLYPEDLGPKAS